MDSFRSLLSRANRSNSSPPNTLRKRDNSARADLIGGGFQGALAITDDVGPVPGISENFQQSSAVAQDLFSFRQPIGSTLPFSRSFDSTVPGAQASFSISPTFVGRIEAVASDTRMDHVLPIQNVDDGHVNLEEELEKLIDNEPQSGPADVDLQGPSNLTPLPSPLPYYTIPLPYEERNYKRLGRCQIKRWQR